MSTRATPGGPALGAHISEAMRTLAAAGGTACLAVGASEIWFSGGRIVRVRLSDGDERLGLRLIASGHILPRELAKAQRLVNDSRTLAEILLERGMARRDVVAHIERRYALQVVLDALTNPDLALSTVEDSPPAPILDLDAEELLAEAAGVVAELADASRLAPPSSTPRLAAGLPGPEVTMSSEDWAVVSRIDGSRTVREIGDECGLTPGEVGLAVLRMTSLGLVEVEDDGSETSWPEQLEVLEAIEEAQGFGEQPEDALAEIAHAPDDSIPDPAHAERFDLLSSPEIEITDVGFAEPEDDPAPVDAFDTPSVIDPDDAAMAVDVAAVLRELSALARDPSPGRADRAR